jgi:hypothetical protein
MTIPEAANSRSVASMPSIDPTSSTAWVFKRHVPGERSPRTVGRLSPSPPSELPTQLLAILGRAAHEGHADRPEDRRHDERETGVDEGHR